MSSGREYVQEVQSYSVNTDFYISSPQYTTYQTYAPIKEEKTLVGMFGIFPGIEPLVLYSYFAGIVRDGRPVLDMTSFEQMLEVLDLCVRLGIEGAHNEISKMNSIYDDAELPWDLETKEMNSHHEHFDTAIKIEFEPMVSKPRPDESICRCGGTQIVERFGIQTRSIDEGLETRAYCVDCLKPYND